MGITFDQPLQPGASAAANWTGVRFKSPFYRAISATVPLAIAGSTVYGFVVLGAGDPGPAVVNYAAAPADVLGLTGIPVASFAGYPLTTIP